MATGMAIQEESHTACRNPHRDIRLKIVALCPGYLGLSIMAEVWSDTKIYRLSGPYVGAILTDSLLALRPAGASRQLLQVVYQKTGLRFALFVRSGASIARTHRHGRIFADMIPFLQEYLQASRAAGDAQSCIRFLLIVSGGNDLYPIVRSGGYARTVTLSAAKSLARSMQEFPCTSAAIVFGASSTVWGYRNWATTKDCEAYDQAVSEVVSAMGEYVTATNGAKELAGVQVADRIGHLSRGSYHLLAQAVARWVSIAAPVAKL